MSALFLQPPPPISPVPILPPALISPPSLSPPPPLSQPHLPPILPPTSGLARRRWRRGALLDRICFTASLAADSIGLRAWPGGGGGGARCRTGACFFTPLTADFGPGPEAAEEGRALLDGEFASLGKGALQDREFASLPPSRRRLRAWPEPDGRGRAHPNTETYSIFHSQASRRGSRCEAKLCSVTDTLTISRTVDHWIRPSLPDGMGIYCVG